MNIEFEEEVAGNSLTVPKMAEVLAPLKKLLKGYTKSSRNMFIKWDSYPKALKAFVAAFAQRGRN